VDKGLCLTSLDVSPSVGHTGIGLGAGFVRLFAEALGVQIADATPGGVKLFLALSRDFRFLERSLGFPRYSHPGPQDSEGGLPGRREESLSATRSSAPRPPRSPWHLSPLASVPLAQPSPSRARGGGGPRAQRLSTGEQTQHASEARGRLGSPRRASCLRRSEFFPIRRREVFSMYPTRRF
jgi:hypothetical protein